MANKCQTGRKLRKGQGLKTVQIVVAKITSIVRTMPWLPKGYCYTLRVRFAVFVTTADTPNIKSITQLSDSAFVLLFLCEKSSTCLRQRSEPRNYYSNTPFLSIWIAGLDAWKKRGDCHAPSLSRRPYSE